MIPSGTNSDCLSAVGAVLFDALASDEREAGDDPLPTAKLGATSCVFCGCCASRVEIREGPLSSATVAGVGTGLVWAALCVLLELFEFRG